MAVDPIRCAGGPQVRVAGARTHQLFEQHARMVYGLCRALLRDPDEADDATQATFVSAYKSLLGGCEVREPSAWLATIARNECAARARARMREPLPLFETDLAQTPGPEVELERKAAVGELQQAISELPEKQREAVVLRDLYGLHYTEVGAALGMSVASVESLLFRARRSLRVSLKPLVSGALVVPVAVREGVAQALPAFSAAGAAGGGATSGAVGLGLLAKLTGGPIAVKAAAGLAAAVAAGSIAVAEVEHTGGQPPTQGRSFSLQKRHARVAAGEPSLGGVSGVAFAAHPASLTTRIRSTDAVTSSGDEGKRVEEAAAARSGDGGREGTNHNRSGESKQLGDDAVASGVSGRSREPVDPSRPDRGDSENGRAGSNGGDGSRDTGAPSESAAVPSQGEGVLESGRTSSPAGKGSTEDGGDPHRDNGSVGSEDTGSGSGSLEDTQTAGEHDHETTESGSSDEPPETIPPPA